MLVQTDIKATDEPQVPKPNIVVCSFGEAASPQDVQMSDVCCRILYRPSVSQASLSCLETNNNNIKTQEVLLSASWICTSQECFPLIEGYIIVGMWWIEYLRIMILSLSWKEKPFVHYITVGFQYCGNDHTSQKVVVTCHTFLVACGRWCISVNNSANLWMSLGLFSPALNRLKKSVWLGDV